MKKIISVISFVLVLVMLAGPAAAFKDFPGEDRYYSDGRWWYFHEFVPQFGWEGYPDGTFKPDKVITRAELASYLYKLSVSGVFEWGEYKFGRIEQVRKYKNNFSDVSPKKWYYKAVVWAYECGLVNGVGYGKFDPDSTVTVFEYALIMERFYDAMRTEYFVDDMNGFDFELSTETLEGGIGNYISYGDYLEFISDERCENFLREAILLDPPAWFLRETDFKEIIKHDIWIGGDRKHIDMTRFSPTRGELYRHSHGYYASSYPYS